MTWLALIGCNGPDDETTGPTTFSDEQGVIAGIRTFDGERVGGEPRASLGNQPPATPDSAGITYFFDVTPDRVPLVLQNPLHALGLAAAEVRAETVAAVSFVALPLDQALEADPASPVSFAGDGFVVDLPADSVEIEDLPFEDPYTLAAQRIRPDQRAAVPPVQIAIANDDDLAPTSLHELIVTGAWQEGRRVDVVGEGRFEITLDLEPDSPLLTAPTVYSYQLSNGLLYWGRSEVAQIDPVARTATFPSSSFGWNALGIEGVERGCVVGRLVDTDGEPVDGAEVRSVQEGLAGVDGAYGVGGSFCVAVDPGATTELSVLAFRRDRTAMYRWHGTAVGSAAAPCGGACTDLGEITVEVHPDGDRDRFFSGPGGDCDDGDPGVNPTFAFGDGSWCGGAL